MFADWDDCCGNMVRLSSICNGQEFYSTYCHFTSLSVSAGDTILQGTRLGLSGGTGTCTYPAGALHLHYAFHYSDGSATGASDDSYISFPPFMNPPYLPAEIPRGCCDYCNVSF